MYLFKDCVSNPLFDGGDSGVDAWAVPGGAAHPPAGDPRQLPLPALQHAAVRHTVAVAPHQPANVANTQLSFK